MEKKILRLLIVDDSPDDAEMAVAALRMAGFMLKTQRVQDLASMQTALDKGQWDAVISEHSLPHFGAQLALDLLKRARSDAPFIVVAHQIKDNDLVKIMRSGAHDVILKNQMVRIVPAIERELRVAEDRRAHEKGIEAFKEIEIKHRAVIDGSREAICYCQDGMHIDANKSYLGLFGYQSQSELEGVPLLNLVDKIDQAKFKEFLRKSVDQNPGLSQEFQVTKNDGTRFYAELAISPIVIAGENCVQVLVLDVTKRKAAENRLQYLNQHDPLTGLYNRHYFIQEVDKVVEKTKSSGEPCALLYFDLNQTAEINNILGHATGDRLLLKVARVFREQLGESCVIARFSGDEFAALLNDMTELQIKTAVDSLLLTLKETTFTENGKTFSCDGTVGVVVIDKNSQTVQTVLTKAYQACLQAKPQTSAKAKAAPKVEATVATETPIKINASEPVVATPVVVEAAQKSAPPTQRRPTAPAAKKVVAVPPSTNDLSWKDRLQDAIDRDGFQLAYQPIVNLHGDPAEYFEVLLRLMGGDGKLIHAAQFMPAAEKLGMAPAIDRWVIRQATLSLAALHQEKRQASFFVNLCPGALSDPELLTVLQKQLNVTKIQPAYLVLEADEHAIIANPTESAMFTKALRTIGCRFTVDNFGNSIATLDQLRDLPIDFLKISGTLIRNLSTDNVSQASLKALSELARVLNKQTIAKSVEKAEDLGILWNLGIDYVQGHYFQEADSQLDYQFDSETTIASESSSPSWANGNNR